MQLLKELCEAPGISGREKPVIEIMTRELEKTTDTVTLDPMGNVVGFKKGNGEPAKKVMIAGHMDEIGFVVTHIDKDGFIRFNQRGGHTPKVLLSQRVRIHGREELVGIVEGEPADLTKREDRDKASGLMDLFIDVGLSKEDVARRIGIGDVIVLDREFVDQGETCISKAFDDRVGCYVVLETMKRLNPVNVDVYAVGTTQEEVGLRGAGCAARTINPDFGIAVDVSDAFDVPDIPGHKHVTRLGGGTAIKVSDAASISNHGIVAFMRAAAEKNGIPHQFEVLPFGGTDAGAMQQFGKGPVCTLSIPTRYIHSPNEMIHKKDVEATICLLVEFIETCENCQLAF